MLSCFYCIVDLAHIRRTTGGKALVLGDVKVVFVDEIEATPEQALFFFFPIRAGHQSCLDKGCRQGF